MGSRLTIGALARRSGTTIKTIRYYEEIGLLTPAARGGNRYRYYDEHHVLQLRFIRRAQQLGLTLAEIAQLIDYAREVKCQELRVALDDLFERKIREYELKLNALRTLRRQLQLEHAACSCQAFVLDCDCLPHNGARNT